MSLLALFWRLCLWPMNELHKTETYMQPYGYLDNFGHFNLCGLSMTFWTFLFNSYIAISKDSLGCHIQKLVILLLLVAFRIIILSSRIWYKGSPPKKINFIFILGINLKFMFPIQCWEMQYPNATGQIDWRQAIPLDLNVCLRDMHRCNIVSTGPILSPWSKQ